MFWHILFKKGIIMNEKRLNIICYMTIVLFYLYTVFYIIFGCVELKREEKRIDELYAYAEKINKQAEKENLIYKNDTSSDEPVELLYTEETKLKALIEGYNATIWGDSFIAEVVGDLSLELPLGLSAKVKMHNFAVKYSSTKCYSEGINVVMDSSSAISGILKNRSQYGEKQIIQNGSNKTMKTTIASYSNGEFKADYTGCSYADSDKLPIIENLYTVSEQTVQEVTYFKVKMKNGKPTAYYVQATLDPATSTKNYADFLSVAIGSTPTFASTKISVVLDTQGRMIAATSVDEFTASSEGFNFTAYLTNNYAISCIGEKIVKEYK